jgi:hypothetical protein
VQSIASGVRRRKVDQKLLQRPTHWIQTIGQLERFGSPCSVRGRLSELQIGMKLETLDHGPDVLRRASVLGQCLDTFADLLAPGLDCSQPLSLSFESLCFKLLEMFLSTLEPPFIAALGAEPVQLLRAVEKRSGDRRQLLLQSALVPIAPFLERKIPTTIPGPQRRRRRRLLVKFSGRRRGIENLQVERTCPQVDSQVKTVHRAQPLYPPLVIVDLALPRHAIKCRTQAAEKSQLSLMNRAIEQWADKAPAARRELGSSIRFAPEDSGQSCVRLRQIASGEHLADQRQSGLDLGVDVLFNDRRQDGRIEIILPSPTSV